mgnify:CR=1 FL=1
MKKIKFRLDEEIEKTEEDDHKDCHFKQSICHTSRVDVELRSVILANDLMFSTFLT